MRAHTSLTLMSLLAGVVPVVSAAPSDSCTIPSSPSCSSPGPNTYKPEPCFPNSGVCYPTNYYAAADQGQLSGSSPSTQLMTKCQALCEAQSQCASYVGVVNKAADSNLATGTCFLYNVQQLYPRQCADAPSAIFAYYKQKTCPTTTTTTKSTTTTTKSTTTTKPTTTSSTTTKSSTTSSSTTTTTTSSTTTSSTTTSSTTTSSTTTSSTTTSSTTTSSTTTSSAPPATSTACSTAQYNTCFALSGNQCLCNIRSSDGRTPECNGGSAICSNKKPVTCTTDSDCSAYTGSYDTCVQNDGLFGDSCASPTYCVQQGSCPQPPASSKRDLEAVFFGRIERSVPGRKLVLVD